MAENTATSSASDSGQPPEYHELKRRGLALAQSISGKQWTDYNAHDPGVTILEQVCYALTDLIYRARIDVADHLTHSSAPADRGAIDFERQALQRPERIFPSRPATPDDYRRLIIGTVTGIENVWLRPVEPGESSAPSIRGLYRVLLQAAPELLLSKREQVKQTVSSLYNMQRNLCEDLYSIEYLEEVSCELVADVELERHRDPSDILADIYHVCAREISGAVRVRRFESARGDGLSLEDVFNGPLAEHGLCDETDLSTDAGGASVHGLYEQADVSTHRHGLPVSRFYALVQQVDGVDFVRSLRFNVDGKPCTNHITAGADDAFLRLKVPRALADIHVSLASLGRNVEINVELLRTKIAARGFEHSTGGRDSDAPSSLYSLPQGRPRHFGEYPLLNQQFPRNYGIGRSHLPGSARADAQAGSRQLTGYLLLFDQIMANYAANVESLAHLFSVEDLQQSYFLNPFDAAAHPDLEGIYASDPESVLGEILAHHDNWTERRGRLADHLLGLYGETFTQNSLKHFQPYRSPLEKERRRVDNKLRFIKNIDFLTRDRGAGENWHAALAADSPSAAAVTGGFKRRLAHLLDMDQQQQAWLTVPLAEHGFEMVSDEAFFSRLGSTDKILTQDELDASTEHGTDSVPPRQNVAPIPLQDLVLQFAPLLPLGNSVMSKDLLRRGIDNRSYSLARDRDGEQWTLFFDLGEREQWCPLAEFDGPDAAIDAANGFRELFVRLNANCEGLQVIEHLLLRPRDSKPLVATPDFFSLRVSVIFPLWTARCQDQGFRDLAEETVALNCPAHVVPTVLWLEFDAMCEFESGIRDWLECRAQPDRTEPNLDAAARKLVVFLEKHACTARQSGWYCPDSAESER